ncbi:MAG: MFS transporter [Nanoarchaeota archaeon]|nr:MFS transporter [Nanoarchaeota archaeon]
MHGKHFHYHHWLKSEIIEIYMNLAIRSFALSMGIIFIPIYLLKIGFTLELVFTYYILTFTVFGFAALLTAKLARKIGLKHLIMASIPFYIIFFVLLYLLNGVNMNLLYSLSAVEGFASAFYWVPLHSLFAKYSQKKKARKQVSYIFSVPGIFSILGPLIGGGIIITFGFKVLLLIISILLFTSLIPLFSTKDFRPRKKFLLKDVLDKEHTKFFAGFFLHGVIYIAAAVLWPLFVYSILKDYVSLGITGTIVSISVVSFPLILGYLAKKVTLITLIKVGGFGAFIVFSIVPYIRGNIAIYLASFFVGTVMILVEMPFYTLALKTAAKKNPLEFMIFREIALTAGRVSILTTLLILGGNFFAGFSITSATSLIAMII